MNVTECAEYKLVIEIYADKISDLEQLLCVIGEEILSGAITGNGGGCIGSYVFNLEENLNKMGQANNLPHTDQAVERCFCGDPVWDAGAGVCWYHENNPPGG